MMAGRVTESGWHYLIDGDIGWLEKQPRTLEQEHTLEVMKHVRKIRPKDFEDLAELAALRAENERLRELLNDILDREHLSEVASKSIENELKVQS